MKKWGMFMADLFVEYVLPVAGIIILIGLAVLVVMAVMWGGTQLTQMWCA